MNNITAMLLVNRGFAGRRIKTDENTLSTEEVRQWHEVLDALHSVAYDVASARYNGEVGDGCEALVSRFYKVMQGVYGMIGTLDNGAKLRSDAATCNVIVGMATCQKSKKSEEIQYLMSAKSLEARRLAQLEKSNGASEEAKAKHAENIQAYEEQIQALRKESMQVWRQYSKSTKSAFYKAVEDFIADMIESRRCMTEEEVQAEKKALDAERKARREANKKNK